MITDLANISIIFSIFYFIDKSLTNYTKLDGIYYLLHSIHNGAIVYLTANDVYTSIFEFSAILTSSKNTMAMDFVFALHLYHIALYWRKFRFDDWLHHILMIGVALPIGAYADSKSLLGYSLFFTTGLPGGIDYFLLFLTRNNWLNKNYEKNINSWLNTWIRSPGCISHATLSLVLTHSEYLQYSLDWWLGISVSFLTYWNGQYFMKQVVENNIIIKNNLMNKYI
jgi:hypothetical protein